MFKHILLCTHGSNGAKKAEALVFKRLAFSGNVQVTVLTVLDADWSLMTGDDWLNSSKTHTDFLDHVEEQVSEEIKEDWQRIHDEFEVGNANFIQRTGKIAETIAHTAWQQECDLIVIGTFQKIKLLSANKEKGLRARMKNDVLHPLLPCPLLIAP